MDLIKELNRIKTDKHKCLGCGYEHNCTIKGCAIINQAIEELKKSKQSCEIVQILSQFTGNKNEPIQNKLMQELIKVKSELDITISQLEGKCWCCKHLQQGILHFSGGRITSECICDKLKHRDLRENCEYWERNWYVENQEEKI